MPFLWPQEICRHSTNRDVELLLKPVTFSGKASGSVNQSWRKLSERFLKVINNSNCNAVCILYVVFLRLIPSFSFDLDVSNTRNRFSPHFKHFEAPKNIKPLRAIFSTLFWAFENVVKRGISSVFDITSVQGSICPRSILPMNFSRNFPCFFQRLALHWLVTVSARSASDVAFIFIVVENGNSNQALALEENIWIVN